MNPRTQLQPASPRQPITYSGTTVDAYLNKLAEDYKKSSYLEDLTCLRLARIAICKEVRHTLKVKFTYRQACSLLPVHNFQQQE